MRCVACNEEFRGYKRKIVTEDHNTIFIEENLCAKCRNTMTQEVDDPSTLGVDATE